MYFLNIASTLGMALLYPASSFKSYALSNKHAWLNTTETVDVAISLVNLKVSTCYTELVHRHFCSRSESIYSANSSIQLATTWYVGRLVSMCALCAWLTIACHGLIDVRYVTILLIRSYSFTSTGE